MKLIQQCTDAFALAFPPQWRIDDKKNDNDNFERPGTLFHPYGVKIQNMNPAR
jgi:hypothetical protein